MAELPPSRRSITHLLLLLLEAFREIAKRYEWIIAFIFGGVIGLPLLLNEFFHNWILSLLWSIAIYFVMALIFFVWGLLNLLSRERERLAALAALRYQDEEQALGLSLYRQLRVYLENHLHANGTWESYSEIQIEVISEEGVDTIPHYNREAASAGVAFLNYKCTGKVLDISDGHDWQFKYFLRGDPKPNAVDILFSFTPPLREGARVRYMYKQSYGGIVPLTYEQVVDSLARRITHRREVRIVKGYRILCKTKKFTRKIVFPDNYAINNVRPNVLFRGVVVPQELERTSESFVAQKVRDHWEIIWEIDDPLQDYVYYINWTPTRRPTIHEPQDATASLTDDLYVNSDSPEKR